MRFFASIGLFFLLSLNGFGQMTSLEKYHSADSRMKNYLVQVDSLPEELAWTYSGFIAVDQKEVGEKLVVHVSGIVMNVPSKKFRYSMFQKKLLSSSVTERGEVLQVDKTNLVKVYGVEGGGVPKGQVLRETPEDEALLSHLRRSIPIEPFSSPLSFQLMSLSTFDAGKIWLSMELVEEDNANGELLKGTWKNDRGGNRSRYIVEFDDRMGGMPTDLSFFLVDADGKRTDQMTGHSKTTWKKVSDEFWMPVRSTKYSGSAHGTNEADVEFEVFVGKRFEELKLKLDWDSLIGAGRSETNWFEVVTEGIDKIKN